MPRPQLPAGADEYAFYLSVLLQEREGFLALHTELQAAHPDWIPGKDARLALVAKPVNLLFNAAMNIRLTQRFLIYPQWWAANVSPEFGTLETMKAPMFDLQLFYRFAFVLLLLSNIEHGFRAMKPRVVDGLDGQSDEAYWKVYTSLFRASLVAETAARHINTWKFLATLRNTIHNNGTFYPNDHKDATFSIGGYEYAFRDGQSVEAFGLDNVAVYLQEIRLGFADLLSSPRVSSIPAIHDFAYTPLSGTPSRGDGTA